MVSQCETCKMRITHFETSLHCFAAFCNVVPAVIWRRKTCKIASVFLTGPSTKQTDAGMTAGGTPISKRRAIRSACACLEQLFPKQDEQLSMCRLHNGIPPQQRQYT